MLAASEKYRGEATGGWHANSFAIFPFGRNQHNRHVLGIMTETFAGAGGARTFADGVDLGGLITNPISRMANVETVEGHFPLRYLFRRRRMNSGGPGKYRGGAGMEFAVVPHDAPDGGVNYVISGKGQAHALTEGLAGGFPGARNRFVWAKTQSTGNQPPTMALRLEDLPGEKQDVSWGVFPLMKQDALYVAVNGGGGYLDPLERDPEAVLKDVRDRVVSIDVARQVYGTVIDDGALNVTATKELRGKLYSQRKGATT